MSCEEAIAASLARIDARERDVGAWAHVDRAGALARARGLDRDGGSGPLHGLPIGVKDVIDTADMPTEYGSPIYAGHRPRGGRGMRPPAEGGRARSSSARR